MATPLGQYTNARRLTGRAAVRAAIVKAGTIASSSGSAKVTPTPRRNVRLGSARFVTIMAAFSSSGKAGSRRCP
jgi:hypothetical protein